MDWINFQLQWKKEWRACCKSTLIGSDLFIYSMLVRIHTSQLLLCQLLGKFLLESAVPLPNETTPAR